MDAATTLEALLELVRVQGVQLQALREDLKDLKGRMAPIPPARLHARLISLTEAARRLGIHPGPNMDYLVETGQLPLTKIQGRARSKVAAAEVDRLIREGFKLPRQ